MTIAVDWDVKQQTKQNDGYHIYVNEGYIFLTCMSSYLVGLQV